jgi:argininosuccinate synthase
VKLHGGTAQVVARGSPYSLYDGGLATYGAGDAFKTEAAEGFLYMLTMPSRTWALAGGNAKEAGPWAKK